VFVIVDIFYIFLCTYPSISIVSLGVTVVDISVECLAEDRDLAARLTRDEFESRSMSLVNRLRAPVEQCLAEAGLTCKDLSDVEVVGGSTRINIIKKTLAEVLGKFESVVVSYCFTVF
jgi:molecular chaperone DnaK (HSP70)